MYAATYTITSLTYKTIKKILFRSISKKVLGVGVFIYGTLIRYCYIPYLYGGIFQIPVLSSVYWNATILSNQVIYLVYLNASFFTFIQ